MQSARTYSMHALRRRVLTAGLGPRTPAALPPCTRKVHVSSAFSRWHIGGGALDPLSIARVPKEWPQQDFEVALSAGRERAVTPELTSWFVLPLADPAPGVANKLATSVLQDGPPSDRPVSLELDSVKKKRRKKMNKHKLKKRRKRDRNKKRVLAQK